jgi:Type IIA topoisomerase (DNA gyrase/topo II, topoisomerase IV), A subunit
MVCCEVIICCTVFELCKVRECGYVLEGLVVVLVNVDEMIVLIKVALMLLDVKCELMVRSWKLLVVEEMLKCVAMEVFCSDGLLVDFGFMFDGYCLFEV